MLLERNNNDIVIRVSSSVDSFGLQRLIDYVKYLEGLAAQYKVNIRQYENLYKLVSVLVYEKKINFNVVDKERSNLIDAVTKKLDKEKLTELVNKSLEFNIVINKSSMIPCITL